MHKKAHGKQRQMAPVWACMGCSDGDNPFLFFTKKEAFANILIAKTQAMCYPIIDIV